MTENTALHYPLSGQKVFKLLTVCFVNVVSSQWVSDRVITNTD